MKYDPSETVRIGYNQAAKNYHKERTGDLLDIELFKQFAVQTQRILELGCGSGYPVGKYLIKLDKDYVGVDISEQQIELAKKNIPAGEFIVSDMVTFLQHTRKHRFDGVVALFSIFHIPRELHTMVLKSIFNILVPGGYFLMNTGNHAYEGIETNWLGAEEMFWSMMSPDWYELTLVDLGFELIKRESVKIQFCGEDETTDFFFVRKPIKH